MSDHERFDQVAYDKKANEQFTKKYLNKIVDTYYVGSCKDLSNK